MKYALFIAAYCLWACELRADSIPTLIATSRSAAFGNAEGLTFSSTGGSFGVLLVALGIVVAMAARVQRNRRKDSRVSTA